jgi:ATP-binding cassette subfamily B protein RaxB
MAAIAVMDEQFSVGMLFAYLSYKEQFSLRLSALIDKLFELKMLRLHGERVADIVLTEPEDQLSVNQADVSNIVPSVELRDIKFRYAPGERSVIRKFNLFIPAGQCIAITGSSGCGKTTLVKILLGLLEPEEGEVLVSGKRIQLLGLRNFREIVGTVMQEDSLFAGSIADNISFFDPTVSQDKVESSAKLASIHLDIVEMPMGYNTLVGDIGSGLSGGQKQRILLARALYKDPKILILDEATSNLDVGHELLVNAAMRNIDLTRILIAHRPETISMADRVVLIEGGRIVRDDLQTSSVSHIAPDE